MKFFKDKYPTSKYEETLSLLSAETYYKIWKRDKKTVDQETALNQWPSTDPMSSPLQVSNSDLSTSLENAF